ncbi:helix-turn-helix domain-containing protein [Corallococcus sp. AB045]|uniref:helix-turn-helix domain-containing protein n=1 Tax=Corallococcus sp. AB045 TaxID=2316719 RepID=UPI002103CE21|nr:helix-turn-helix domain-containing protein [Corallococcus sp. AB045]
MEAEGKAWGRPSRPSDADRGRIAAMKQMGRSIRAIAVALKVPRSTVARALAAGPESAVA